MSAIDKFVKNTTYSPDQKYIYRLPPQVFTPGVTVLIGGVEQPKEELEKYDRELLRGYRPDGEPNEPVLSLVNTEEEMQTLLLKVLGIPVAFTLLYLILGLVGVNFGAHPELWVFALTALYVGSGVYCIWAARKNNGRHLLGLYKYNCSKDSAVMSRRQMLIGRSLKLYESLRSYEKEISKLRERIEELEESDEVFIREGANVRSKDAVIRSIENKIYVLENQAEGIRADLGRLQDSLAFSGLAFLSTDPVQRAKFLRA